MRKIVIIGDSGHAKVITDVVHSNDDFKVFAKLDDKYESVFEEDGFLKGPLSHLDELIKVEPELGIVIGIGSNKARKSIVEKLGLAPTMYISAIHITAIISPTTELGVGTVVMPGVIVNADTKIGDHVILNSGCVIEHDCKIENYVHVSPLAAITGGVELHEGTHIGAGASVIPLTKIGSWSVIGAGAVVVNDISDGVTAVGAPARAIRKEGF